MSEVTVRELSKTFRGSMGESVHALNSVTLSADQGAFVVLLGPSGCGKTTLLRCIAGLEEPTGGEISLGDRVVSSVPRGIHVPPGKRRIGMVFQSYALWPQMTVRDNVKFPLRRGESADKVTASLELVGCLPLAERYPHQLSGGQQQRVALARALVSRPDVLLLDEPLSNLDAILRDRMRGEIRRIQRTINCTAVYVTHDQREALALADLLVVMNQGRICQAGPPEQVYEQPVSAFVASFLGSANLFKVDSHDAGQVHTALGMLRVRSSSAPPPRDCAVAIRAEAIRVLCAGADAAPSGSNVVRARLTGLEYLGDHWQGMFSLGARSIRVTLPPKDRLQPGEEYDLCISPEDCVLVDYSDAEELAPQAVEP